MSHPIQTAEDSLVATPPSRTASAASSLAEALFSTDAGPPPAERMVWLGRELDDFLAHAGARSNFVFRLALFAVSLIAPWFIWKLGPLRALPVADRITALGRLEESPLGLSLFAVKAILCILYYEHPDAAAEIGFDGSCLKGPTRALPIATESDR
jgi:hypothetical protein